MSRPLMKSLLCPKFSVPAPQKKSMNTRPSAASSSAPLARLNTAGNVRQYSRTSDSSDSKTETSLAYLMPCTVLRPPDEDHRQPECHERGAGAGFDHGWDHRSAKPLDRAALMRLVSCETNTVLLARRGDMIVG